MNQRTSTMLIDAPPTVLNKRPSTVPRWVPIVALVLAILFALTAGALLILDLARTIPQYPFNIDEWI